MSNALVDAILVDELTTLLLRLSNYKIDKAVARSLAESNLKKLDLNNRFIAHKGLSWVAKQIIKNQKI